MKLGLVCFIGGLLLVQSCTKDEELSVVPEIEFQEYLVYRNAAGKDTAIDFIFTLKDGDGDIGFFSDELDTSCGADNSNLYLTYQTLSGGSYRVKKFWTQVIEYIPPACDSLVYFDSVAVQFNQRIQYLAPEGSSRTLEATVTYRITYDAGLFLLDPAGRFEYYLRDRAGHLSNTDYSADLFLNL